MSENDESQNPSGATPTPVPTGDDIPVAAETLAAPTPEQRIAALETEKLEIKDRMLRIAAEFDNYKKRARKELSDQEVKARESVLKDFLEVVDNLERALASIGTGTTEKDVKSVQDGVELVLRLFKSKLERYGVKVIEAKGQPFDPRMHDAISQIPSPDVAPGTIVHEMQKGYRVGDRLLRPAVVVVAAAAPSTPAPASGGANAQGGSADGSETSNKGDKPS
jgi:molecular chaperone GrpE